MTSPFESISPLPDEIRRGLIAMSCVGLTSLVSCCLLCLHISYKLILWKLRDWRSQRKQAAGPVITTSGRGSIDLNMGLAEAHYYRAKRKRSGSNKAADDDDDAAASMPPLTFQASETATKSHEGEPDASPPPSARREKPPNPLLLLVYNLILADITLSMCYAADVSWLMMDGIIAPSTTCTAQGWMVGWGCLTTSGLLFTISVFSYLGIIRGYKATTRDVVIACSSVWTLSVVLASLGPIYFHDRDTFYGRETMWCWISEEHKLWRLTIYLWGFPTMAATGCIYSVIFYKLWREGRSSRFMPRRQHSTTTHASRAGGSGDSNGREGGTALRPSGHHPAFLIYPCIYSVTGTPLMLGSIIPALERNPYFMSTAGALLAMTGLLDTILWSSIILFSKSEDLANVGLHQFSFMRTPEGRTLGNIVFVQGGGQGGDRRLNRQSWQSKKEKGWWRLGDRNSSPTSVSRAWPADYERANHGIQMEIVTSVLVEEESSQRQTRNTSIRRPASLESLA